MALFAFIRVHSRLKTFCLSLFAASCGYVGPIQPPALDIPSQITDLRAAERGDQIVTEFTLPALTTEGLPLKSVRLVEVRVGPGDNPFVMEKWAAAAQKFEVQATKPGALTKDIPASAWIGKEVVIAVRATGPKGKPSAWSYPKALSVEPPLASPTAFKAENDPKGVKLTWRGAGPKFRIFRATGEATPELLKEVDRPEHLDDSTQYDTRYRYFVQAIEDEFHQSETTASAPITPVDEFPPAVPEGLAATPGVTTIELAWTRNTESDFKGYNVYRSVDGGAFEKIAEMITAPAFSDNKVEAGKKYRYTVSAVDLKGNESGRPTPQEAALQQ